jgi:DNA gyrase/topoisomerase IV subunit A
LSEGEYITTMLPVDLEAEARLRRKRLKAEEEIENSNETDIVLQMAPFIFMSTANGTVKKTPLVAFSRQRSVGLIALELDEGDILISARLSPMASRKSCCSPTAARSLASRNPKFAPWAVPPAVCVACVCRKGRS